MLDLPLPTKGARVEDVDETTVSSDPSVAKSRWSTGGIIYPPPDIRSIVDKTAAFVARNGTSFETKIKGDERANTNFSFLNDSDAFNAYYRAKIEALRDGTGPLATAEGPGNGQVVQSAIGTRPEPARTTEEAQDAAPPEPRSLLFSADMPNITAVDLDILKLTALFVAQKGRAFAQALLAKEARSYQFEFLRPNHSLFGFFNRLVEQYRLVIDPPSELLAQLSLGSSSSSSDEDRRSHAADFKLGIGAGGARQSVLKQARERAQWEKYAEQRRKKKADEEAEQQAAFAEIDWQDFVVVSTVEITEADSHIDLPVPMSLREVETMTMAQKRLAAMIMEEEGADGDDAAQKVGIVDLPAASKSQRAGDGDGDGDEMQMEESDDDTESKPQTAQQGSTGPAATAPIASTSKPPANIKIRKDYVPKTLAERQRQSAQQATTKCPVCGELVPTAEMDEHVRIELLNPKYRQQRADLEARMAQQTALTEGADPSRVLRSFAGNRRDIFGLQEQEMSLAQREEEERKRAREREKIVWDGHAASRTRTTGDYNRTEQIEAQAKTMQARFKPKDTESIGPQARPNTDGFDQSNLQLPSVNESEHVVGADGSSAPVSYASAGTKRPATGQSVDGVQQPPLQRVAYQGPNGSASPAAPSGPSGYHNGPPPGFAQGPAFPQPGFAPPQHHQYDGQQGTTDHQPNYTGPPTASIQLQLPEGDKILSYTDLPLHTTVAAIRDRVHAEEFSTVGASRIKLKLIRTGRVLNLKQTLLEIGIVPAADQGSTEVIEVTVK